MRVIASSLRRALVGAFHRAASIKFGKRFDVIAAQIMLRIIGLYQVLLSPLLGKQCLFSPTCSNRSAAVIRKHGWSIGMPLASAQIRRCCGNFRVGLNADEKIELRCSDGTVFAEEELSPAILERYGFFVRSVRTEKS
ncbi:membrane protein insertion efficiency factor YidD [Hyphomicrobium sp. D-2]|uniref:membrane protein insertion efficiency factor YidD n=1 Tax=Hyphomicrobium sp. D-2 TaxID=3041621 RepID=UPI00245812D1|nr:membrane protein insertion efficiency factor YidD [Hyphomicrobium sp. D-2]MDH4981662.1 membrane protein insertion efficiency factor YidD [Hyphomicrobium sp. D-2]